MITSTANAQVKVVVQLQKKAKERDAKQLFVIEGRKLFEEIRRDAPTHLEKTYVTEEFLQQYEKSGLLAGVDYETVSPEVMQVMAETMTPQGILALVRMPRYTLASMLEKEDALLVLLEELRDPGNLGTIMRTAEGAGATGIVLSRGSVDMYNPKVIRSTMGAIFRMPFVYVEDFCETLQELQREGVTLYAAHLHGKNFYEVESYAGKTGLLIGNEANGLTEEASACADKLIKIPMEGKVESLNAAVATAILLYEVYRNKKTGK